MSALRSLHSDCLHALLQYLRRLACPCEIVFLQFLYSHCLYFGAGLVVMVARRVGVLKGYAAGLGLLF